MRVFVGPSHEYSISIMARPKSFDQQEVLGKALNLFWEKGYNATSIQDLVDHLGINRASIYDTWGDKRGLYLETLKSYRKKSSNSFLDRLRSDLSSKEILKGFLNDVIHEAIEDAGNKGCFLSNSASELANSDRTIFEIFSSNNENMEAVLSELVKDGQEAGEISRKHSPNAIARFILSNTMGIRIMAKGRKSEKALEEIVKVALSILD